MPTTYKRGPLEPIDDECSHLGNNFRHLRERQHVTLQHLAGEMGVSVNTIRQHEAGSKPLRAHHLRRAARVLGVRAGLLLHTMEERISAPTQRPPNG